MEKIYADLIKKGKKTIEDVPKILREKSKRFLVRKQLTRIACFYIERRWNVMKFKKIGRMKVCTKVKGKNEQDTGFVFIAMIEALQHWNSCFVIKIIKLLISPIPPLKSY